MVRRDEPARADARYELAHDFVVRSVISAWKALDRRRTQEAAVVAEQQRQKASRLIELAKTERRGSWAILVLTAALILMVGIFAVEVFDAGVQYSFVLANAFYAIPAVALFCLSFVLRVRTGMLFAVVAAGLLTVLWPPWRWPITPAVISHGAVVLFCLLPAMMCGIPRMDQSASRRRFWKILGVAFFDYALLPGCVVAAFSLSGDAFLATPSRFSSGTFSLDMFSLDAFTPLAVLLGIVLFAQVIMILGTKTTIGE